jgi:hypothetical protein
MTIIRESLGHADFSNESNTPKQRKYNKKTQFKDVDFSNESNTPKQRKYNKKTQFKDVHCTCTLTSICKKEEDYFSGHRSMSPLAGSRL